MGVATAVFRVLACLGAGCSRLQRLALRSQTFPRARTHTSSLASPEPWAWLGAPSFTPVPGVGPSPSARVVARLLEGAPLNAAAAYLRARELEPLLVAAGGGGRAYLRREDRGRTQATPEKLQNRSAAPGSAGEAGLRVRARAEAGRRPCSPPRGRPSRGLSAGGGDGWTSRVPSPPAGRSPRKGAEGGQGCREAWATLGWASAGGFTGEGGGHPGK